MFPLVRMARRRSGIFGSLPGIVLVHLIFGMPFMTLLFRNYYAAIPQELFHAARIDGGGFWRIFVQLMLPMSLPIIVVAAIMQVTGVWNDYILGLVFAGRDNMPMTVQLNNVINTTTGDPPVQRQHGGHHPHFAGAAGDLFHFRPLVRARHRRRRGKRLIHVERASSESGHQPWRRRDHQGSRPGGGGGRVPGPARPFRLRQVDPAAQHRRPDRRHRRQRGDRRARHDAWPIRANAASAWCSSRMRCIRP